MRLCKAEASFRVRGGLGGALSRFLGVVFAAALVLVPAAARAVVVVGADQIGSAGAFVVTNAAPSALQANPAVATSTKRFEMQVGMAGMNWDGPASVQVGSARDPDAPMVSPTHDGILYGPLQFHAFAVARIAPQISMGVALAPVEGPERSSYHPFWPDDQFVKLVSYSLVPSASYEVAQAWSVGIGVQLNRTALADDSWSADGLTGGDASYGIGLTLGSRIVLLGERLVLGLSYRSPIVEDDPIAATIPFVLQAGASVVASSTVRLGLHVAQSGEEKIFSIPFSFRPISSTTEVRFGMEWDALSWVVARAGVLYEIERPFTFDAATMVPPGMESLKSPAPEHKTWGIGAGAGFVLARGLRLDGGVRIDSPDETTRIYGGLSLEWAHRD